MFFLLIFISLELGGLLKFVRPFLISISKAKAARLVRSLLDLFLDMEAATGQEVELCLECIEWAKAEKRTFLRQALEVRKQMPPTVQMQHNLPYTKRYCLLKKYFYDELCWAESRSHRSDTFEAIQITQFMLAKRKQNKLFISA